jgi:flagellar basal body rod protein FlgC
MTSILNIAVSGLNDAVTRIANATTNIVNASSTSKNPGPGQSYTGFQPQDVVTISTAAGGNAEGVTSALVPRSPAYTVQPADAYTSYETGQNTVAAPNVDLNSELIASKEAEISYGANAKVIKITEEMQQSLLDAVS